MDWLFVPWPWYVAGPIIGLFPALLLVLGNRLFGVSGVLRDSCAAVCPAGLDVYRHDWRRGAWNMAFTAGILIGGVIAGWALANPEPVGIARATREALAALGVRDFTGLVPSDLFTWGAFETWRGWALLAGGGFLVGFGTAWAGGCTSGHGLSGIANLELASFIALVGFFAGGIAGTFLLLPWLV